MAVRLPGQPDDGMCFIAAGYILIPMQATAAVWKMKSEEGTAIFPLFRIPYSVNDD